MTDTPDRDPCPELLRAGPPPLDERLRRDTWRRLQGALRRRRWWQRAAVAAGLAACYLAGLGTAHLGTEPAPPVVVVDGRDRPPEASRPADPPPPLLQEWQALDSPAPRPEVFRQAGDRYAAEEGDYQSALRCYRDALDVGAAQDRAIAPTDSWLLMVLKDARQKEKRDANAHE